MYKKLADICGYEFPTNLQNFTQKNLTEVKIFQKVLGGGATAFETPCIFLIRLDVPCYALVLNGFR